MEKQTIELIRQAQAGNEDAFTQLHHDFYRCVFYKAWQLTRNEADAKDIVQEVFYEVHRSLPKLQDPQHFYSWLMMITTSRTKNLFRKHQHDATFCDHIQELNVQEKRIYANPKQRMDDQSEQEVIMQLIKQMPEKYAEVIVMVYLKEMKLQEVADLLQVPLGTVKTRVVRGRKELKGLIEAYEIKEQRKIAFHMDTLVPISFLGLHHVTSLIECLVKESKKAWTTISSNAVTSCCAVSFSVLAVSGGTFLYDDYQKTAQIDQNLPQEQEQSIQDHPSKQIERPSNLQQVLQKKAFPETSYQGTKIASSRDAYYICLNFAYTEEEMKEHTKEEYREIVPIYEVFKNENSIHYQELQKQGWTAVFESYAYSDI